MASQQATEAEAPDLQSSRQYTESGPPVTASKHAVAPVYKALPRRYAARLLGWFHGM